MRIVGERRYPGAMASVKKGVLTPAGKWWKHLRGLKRRFWKGERQAGKAAVKKDVQARD